MTGQNVTFMNHQTFDSTRHTRHTRRAEARAPAHARTPRPFFSALDVRFQQRALRGDRPMSHKIAHVSDSPLNAKTSRPDAVVWGPIDGPTAERLGLYACPRGHRRGPALAGSPSEKIFHFMLFATRRRREPSRPAASVPLHTARHAVCSGTLAVSRRCRVRHWQRNKLPGLCSADGGVEQMKKILSE